jgi:hypothetical protein
MGEVLRHDRGVHLAAAFRHERVEFVRGDYSTKRRRRAFFRQTV